MVTWRLTVHWHLGHHSNNNRARRLCSWKMSACFLLAEHNSFCTWSTVVGFMLHRLRLRKRSAWCVMLSVQQPWTLWGSMTIAIAECDLAGWCFRIIPVQVAQKRSAVSTWWTVFIEHSSIFTWSTVIRFVLFGKGVRAMMLLIEQPWTAIGNRWSTVIGFISLHMFIIGFIS